MILKTRKRASLYLRLVGFCVFFTAFFLPAIRLGQDGPGPSIEEGFECALFALIPAYALILGHGLGSDPGSFLLLLSGLVNPLVMVYLLFCGWPSFVRTWRGLAASILICIAATWRFFTDSHTTPIIGHFIWVTGILMMLLPEAFGNGSKFGVPEKETESLNQPVSNG